MAREGRKWRQKDRLPHYILFSCSTVHVRQEHCNHEFSKSSPIRGLLLQCRQKRDSSIAERRKSISQTGHMCHGQLCLPAFLSKKTSGSCHLENAVNHLPTRDLHSVQSHTNSEKFHSKKQKQKKKQLKFLHPEFFHKSTLTPFIKKQLYLLKQASSRQP